MRFYGWLKNALLKAVCLVNKSIWKCSNVFDSWEQSVIDGWNLSKRLFSTYWILSIWFENWKFDKRIDKYFCFSKIDRKKIFSKNFKIFNFRNKFLFAKFRLILPILYQNDVRPYFCMKINTIFINLLTYALWSSLENKFGKCNVNSLSHIETINDKTLWF